MYIYCVYLGFFRDYVQHQEPLVHVCMRVFVHYLSSFICRLFHLQVRTSVKLLTYCSFYFKHIYMHLLLKTPRPFSCKVTFGLSQNSFFLSKVLKKCFTPLIKCLINQFQMWSLYVKRPPSPLVSLNPHSALLIVMSSSDNTICITGLEWFKFLSDRHFSLEIGKLFSSSTKFICAFSRVQIWTLFFYLHASPWSHSM